MMYDAKQFFDHPAKFRRVWKWGTVMLTDGSCRGVSRVTDRMIREGLVEAVTDPQTREWVVADAHAGAPAQ